MLDWIWDNSGRIGDLSQAVGVCLTLFALGFAAGQIASGRVSQREATAKEVWRDYELLGLQHPDLALPDSGDCDADAEAFQGSREKFKKYRWYVSFMLLACEEILLCTRNREDWLSAIERQIRRHKDYIGSDFFRKSGHLKELHPVLRSMIDRHALSGGLNTP